MGKSNIGETAYEAYTQSSGGKSLVTGELLPKFAEQPEPIQNAWHAAAGAVWEVAELAFGSSPGNRKLPPKAREES